MTPLAPASAAARNLVSFWNEARLRAEHAKSTSVRPAPGIVPWREALEDILEVGYGLQTQSRFIGGAWERVRWRTTPSAGALYPFEVIAAVAGEGCYLWDVEKGRLAPCGLAPLGAADLAAAGFLTAPGHRLEALLILVARPWLSMRKYRLRGYAYCHLDVGHVAANLALYTTALGFAPALHLRFSRTAVAAHLQLAGLCREPLAALSFASAAPAGGPRPGEPEDGLPPRRLELPGPLELESWESLSGILSFDSTLEPPCVPAGASLLLEPAAGRGRSRLALPDGRPQPSSAVEWRAAILGRRSAKGFRAEPLSVAQIGELLGALRAEGLPADCSPDGSARLGVRLVARNVDGLAGVFAYSRRGHALERIDAQADDPRPACMQQEMAGNVAALVILHAPICRLVDRRGYSAFAELHFHAAQLAQRLHLAAARLGVGITCIGGFDGEHCATLARLDADGPVDPDAGFGEGGTGAGAGGEGGGGVGGGGGDEAVYVILLGVPDDTAVKRDRLSVAFSHGYVTEEG